ncbi:MAG: hypothetical protein ABIP03_14260 [Aquihabitans sp.]
MTTDEEQAEGPTGALPESSIKLPTIRSSRSARRIVVAVVISVLTIAGLTAWVLLVPYQDTVVGPPLRCDATVDWVDSPAGLAQEKVFEKQCDKKRSSRRTTALLIGAGVATAACAVSTWPSKRLTGEALGPLR